MNETGKNPLPTHQRTALTVAFCTFRRADRLPALVAALRAQACRVPFEILAINNNSPDHTLQVLARLQEQPGAPLRVVTEEAPGIVPARNRAIEESLHRDILLFIDDDELPLPGLLEAALDAIVNEGAQCAGGRVAMDFSSIKRPGWLEDEMLGFLASVDHGDAPFWITTPSTPVWTANVAYDLSLFRNDDSLRFDGRYNREGAEVGGGEDAIMLESLLARGVRIRYRPDMAVLHAVDAWRLRRGYFIELHYRAGIRRGRFNLPDFSVGALGVPAFMVSQFLVHCFRTAVMYVTFRPGRLRQAMNAANALGIMIGYRARQR